MAPSYVLLDREVQFNHDAAVFVGASQGLEEESIGLAYGKGAPPSRDEMRDAVTAYVQSLKPDAHVADPPELSTLRMLRPTKSIPPLCDLVTSASISSADKHLVAIYAGAYRPGTLRRGCYLIYDAMKNSLSTIPQLPSDYSCAAIGCESAVVVCNGEGNGYVLAELIRVRSSDDSGAALCLWQSSAAEWAMKPGRMPLEVRSPAYNFISDVCFSSGGSILCWVDLLQGMVACDLRPVQEHGSDPEFRFVPLPEGCPTYDHHRHSHGRPVIGQEFRSMACIGGAVKFVAMQGYGELPGSEVMLTIWTLSPDLCQWKKCMAYRLADVWENETYRSMGLLQALPTLPVLSVHEDGVVYLVVTDARMLAGDRLEFRHQYLLRVDVGNNEVQFCPESIKWLHRQLFASEFSAYLQGVHVKSYKKIN